MVINIPVTRSYDPSRTYPFLTKKFKRREPNIHFYIPVECPYLKRCTDGYCPLAHTKLEIMFHPMVYKSRKCKLAKSGTCRFSWHCTFYDNDAEKLSAQLLWLIWERRWDLWRENIKSVLDLHRKLCYRVMHLLSLVTSNRGEIGPSLGMVSSGNNDETFRNSHLDALFNDQVTIACATKGGVGLSNPDVALLCSMDNPFQAASFDDKMPTTVFYDWFFALGASVYHKPLVFDVMNQ
ncbi:erythrocyte membrane protein, putative [Babesia ovis]|uniref:Erythrocyte membrane protein, putative n=1 Tax=Babesia ovis TaxID=5869 RepID=A0A9W5TA51_BABOV|nr:erythrocyte membrane protein, putative [Babesia ovis]